MSYLRNSWYCAGWSREIDEKPKGIRMLGDYLVLYRDSSRKAVAVTGRCPHRFAPLDRGNLEGDVLACPYHGLQFNSAGVCVLNPHGDGFIPPNAVLRSYPIVEHNRAMWVWMGDAEKADPALLPPESVVMSPAYSTQLLYLKVAANYQLVIDNLLDLTHAPFIHAKTLAGDRSKQSLPHHEYSSDGEVIHSDYYINPSSTAPFMQRLFDDDRGRFSAKMTWRAASNLDLDIWQEPLEGSPAQALNIPSFHYLTPETDTSTHYFSAFSRNLKIDDPEEDAVIESIAMYAFSQEDEPMVRDCQELMGTLDLFSLKPAILKTDIAAVQARRILQKKIRAENPALSETPVAS